MQLFMDAYAGLGDATPEGVVIAYQRCDEAARDRSKPGVRIRPGVSAGESVAGNDDLFDVAARLRARICPHAEPRQPIVSGAVRELSIGKSFSYRDVGSVVLKGFPEPAQPYEVSWP